jgi:hypothetical protein
MPISAERRVYRRDRATNEIAVEYVFVFELLIFALDDAINVAPVIPAEIFKAKISNRHIPFTVADVTPPIFSVNQIEHHLKIAFGVICYHFR